MKSTTCFGTAIVSLIVLLTTTGAGHTFGLTNPALLKANTITDVVQVGAKRSRGFRRRHRSRRTRSFRNTRPRRHTFGGLPTAAWLALQARQRQCMDKLYPSGPCPLTPQ